MLRFSGLVLVAVVAYGETFPLADTKALVEKNVKVAAVAYQGRPAVRLTKEVPEDGFALLKGIDFQDGTIEVDIAVKILASGRMPGFIGVAFRTKADASQYELFYLRPRNSLAEDQAMRNHSVQYTAAPDFGWYRLRREWPFTYESYAELAPETWTKVKIDVKGRVAKLYLNGSSRPSLVVDGLKSENLHGGIALWGYEGEEAYFANLRVTPAAPEAVKNGSDAAGKWEVRCNTDAQPMEGILTLAREGAKLTGTWTGTLGENLPVTGAWREGYVELTFPGTWPKTMGASVATLAGWFDGTAARGRVKVEGRTDGSWVARRVD